MEHKPALYALIDLHARLGARIKQNAKEGDKLRADMVHVEAVVKLLEPTFNVNGIAARRKNNPNPLFKRGMIFRGVLDALRDAPEPMTVDQIGAALFRSKGVLDASKEDRARMYSAVNSSLENHLGKTVERDDRRPRRWRVL